MKARDFEQKAKAIAGNTEHFKLHTELTEHNGHDVCEIHLYMTDPWGQDVLVLTTSSNGDDATDMLVLSDIGNRLKLCKEYTRTHYDYNNRMQL